MMAKMQAKKSTGDDGYQQEGDGNSAEGAFWWQALRLHWK